MATQKQQVNEDWALVANGSALIICQAGIAHVHIAGLSGSAPNANEQAYHEIGASVHLPSYLSYPGNERVYVRAAEGLAELLIDVVL